jgi:hypothetical protein
MTREATCFEMTFRPDSELIIVVRRFVSALYERRITSRDITAQIALTTHELLENAAKYSIDGLATFRLEVIGPADRPEVTITTCNRVNEEHLARVQAQLDEIARHHDPQAYYFDLMQREFASDTGGLGFGRIAAEGDMTLEMSHCGEVLEVRAKYRGGVV